MNRKMMLWACVTLLPFFNGLVMAQGNGRISLTVPESEKFQDTLVIKLSGSGKVLITGLSLMELKELGDYTEKVKTLFINDFTQAVDNKQISTEAEEVHYFVLNEQKRRIKSEAAEYTQNRVDVAFESSRLLMDLPKYHYIIHDIRHKITMDIFISNPDSLLKQLGEVSITEAILKATEKKKLLRKYSKMEISTDSNQYRISNKPTNRLDMIEFSPVLGLGLIGNTWSPLTGGQLVVKFNNKYRVPFIKVGADVTSFAFTEFSKGELLHLTVLTSFNGRFLINLNPSSKNAKPDWLGFQGGYINSPGNKTFHGAFKFGFVFDGGGPFTYSFESITHKGKNNSILAFTLTMPF